MALLHGIVSQKLPADEYCLRRVTRAALPRQMLKKSVLEEENSWALVKGGSVTSLRYSQNILKVRVFPAKGFAMGECVTNWSERVWVLAH